MYYKLVDETNTQNGHLFGAGLNVDTSFLLYERGFTLVEESSLGSWLRSGGTPMKYIYRAECPSGTEYFINKFNLLTVNKVVLSHKMTIDEFFLTCPNAEHIILEGIKCGLSPDDVPKSFTLTREMYQTAVSFNWSHIQYVPVEYLSEELMSLALKGSFSALRFFPEHLLSESILEQAVKKNYRALNFVPASKMTPKLLTLAKKHKDFDPFHVGLACTEKMPEVKAKPVRGRYMDLSDIFTMDDEFS